MAIDRTSTFTFVELRKKATTKVSGDFLRHLVEAVLYKIHTVLSESPVLSEIEEGIHFTTPGADGSAVPEIKLATANGERFWAHSFDKPANKTTSITGSPSRAIPGPTARAN